MSDEINSQKNVHRGTSGFVILDIRRLVPESRKLLLPAEIVKVNIPHRLPSPQRACSIKLSFA